ncbi:MAG: helix-turn-helix transcriptional regulator [Kiritimatiellae bacterium]|nr:helix-turn-helix transcriptional regulator [Kiritimatiellia bacterium]
MAMLSKRLLESVSRDYRRRHRLAVRLMDISGQVSGADVDPLSQLNNASRRRNYALQQSINQGAPYLFESAPGILTWMVALEDRRRIYGGLIGGDVLALADGQSPKPTQRYLVQHGLTDRDADELLRRLPVWETWQAESAADDLAEMFYQQSGWRSELLNENRLRRGQMEQLNRAIEDQRRQGEPALYAFEKERMLLATIRAGDRQGARSLLNEMLAVIYMSSPKLVVLRARAVELLSCLTRAAIEDNPLLEPMIERNHGWTEKLVAARSFEGLSQRLMTALDDFSDTIYLQGVNRSNVKVSQAIDYIGRRYTHPISLRDVADEVGLSPCRLAHLVKTYTGRTVMQLIYQMRVSHAQKLLANTSQSCTDIAYEVGFNDQSYFIKHFKRLTGTTPMRFRRAG